MIFSIGYGRTPHGRVLSDFGALGREGGERLLAVAMTRARRAMTIVTCFEASDIDEDRMQHGAVALAEILTDIQGRTGVDHVPDDSDPMLVDLARRLAFRGLRVALGHRGKLGARGIAPGHVPHHRDRHDDAGDQPARVAAAAPRDAAPPGLALPAGCTPSSSSATPDAVAVRIATMLGVDSAPVTEPMPLISR